MLAEGVAWRNIRTAMNWAYRDILGKAIFLTLLPTRSTNISFCAATHFAVVRTIWTRLQYLPHHPPRAPHPCLTSLARTAGTTVAAGRVASHFPMTNTEGKQAAWRMYAIWMYMGNNAEHYHQMYGPCINMSCDNDA